MTKDEVQAVKMRADQLVASYGALGLTSKMNIAVQQVASLWMLTDIELQITRPGKSIAFSNALKSAVTLASNSGKAAGLTAAAKHAKDVSKVAGLAAKAASVTEKATTFKTAIGKTVKAGAQKAATKPIAATAAALATGVLSAGMAYTCKRELKLFNEQCYRMRLES